MSQYPTVSISLFLKFEQFLIDYHLYFLSETVHMPMLELFDMLSEEFVLLGVVSRWVGEVLMVCGDSLEVFLLFGVRCAFC